MVLGLSAHNGITLHALTPTHTHTHTQNQMAKWNRLVAYLNFGLLLVLLFLILLVFASMYYYRLLSYYENHPDPEDQPSPGGFLTPLA